MIEATDQIQQSPILPESPSLEIPQPDNEPDETSLTAEIAELWRLHTDYKGSIKSQTDNLRGLRSELGKLLHQMKALLAKPGRSGQWSSWLKQHKIARATADRLVLRHKRSLNPDGNCLTESISEPSDEEIKTLLDKVTPKLRRVLRTPASVFRFVDLLTGVFEEVDRRKTEEGILILQPVHQTATVESVPEEAQVEPVPVVTEVLAEGNVESTGSSMVL